MPAVRHWPHFEDPESFNAAAVEFLTLLLAISIVAATYLYLNGQPTTRQLAPPIVAFLLVFALSGLFFGFVNPPGSYGLHPTIGPRHGHWTVFFGD